MRSALKGCIIQTKNTTLAAWALSVNQREAAHQISPTRCRCLQNRITAAACGCEANSGGRRGILVGTPDEFFRREATKRGFTLPSLVAVRGGDGLPSQDAVYVQVREDHRKRR